MDMLNFIYSLNLLVGLLFWVLGSFSVDNAKATKTRKKLRAFDLVSRACSRYGWGFFGFGWGREGPFREELRLRIAGDSVFPRVSWAKSRELRFPANRNFPRRSEIDRSWDVSQPRTTLGPLRRGDRDRRALR